MTALLAELGRRLDQPATLPTTTKTRLESFLNTTHRQILGLPGMESLRNDTITFASVAGQSRYGLPQSIARIEAITDRTTMIRLQARSQDDIRWTDPGLVGNGTADSYVVGGWQQVTRQPAAATGLWAVSSAAGDTMNAFIETIRTGGLPRVGAAVALTGVTRVQLGALTDHVEVTKFYLASAPVGDVDLYDAAVAGNLLARIAIGQTYVRYLGLQLYPTPSSAITYYVDYVRTIPEMVNGTDEPLLPDDFHWLLIEGTLVKEWTRLDDDRRTVAERDYARGLSGLKYFVNCPPDLLPVANGRGGGGGRSRFGAWFGVTRY